MRIRGGLVAHHQHAVCWGFIHSHVSRFVRMIGEMHIETDLSSPIKLGAFFRSKTGNTVRIDWLAQQPTNKPQVSLESPAAMDAQAVAEMAFQPDQLVDFWSIWIAYIAYVPLPLAEKILIGLFRACTGGGHERPPHGRLVAPSLDSVIKHLVFDIPGRDKKRAIKCPKVWNATHIGGEGIIDEAQYFDRLLQFPSQHFRMYEVVSSHNNEVKIPKAIDEIANHAHVIRVAFPVKPIYTSGTGEKCSTLIVTIQTRDNEVRQRPVGALREIDQRIEGFEAVAMEIFHWREIEQADFFHWDNLSSVSRAVKNVIAASKAETSVAAQAMPWVP